MKKLNKGLRRDERSHDLPEGSWSDARNIVLYKGFQAIANEDGMEDVTPCRIVIGQCFPVSKIVIGIIKTNKRKVFFFATNVASDSEIGIVDENGDYQTLIIDPVLNFHSDYPIQGVHEIKFNDNLIVAWSDRGYNPPRILNIDCLPFIVLSTFDIDPADIEKARALLKLFPDVKMPLINDITTNDNGGSMLTGTYYPMVSYGLSDGSSTSWINIYNPLPVVIDNKTLAFKDYDGDVSGLTSSKSLYVKFTDVDTNYTYLNFGVIYQRNGQYTAYYVNKYRISSSTLELVFTNTESTIVELSLEEVLIPNATYPKVWTITTLQSCLLLGNVEKAQEIDYQQYANNIVVEWIREEDISLLEDIDTSYKNSKIVYFDKEFRSDEVYALYIGFGLVDGTKSPGFHIPGREALIGDTDVISGLGDVNVDALGSNVKKFQIYETALANGTMGYWENENEVYPNIADFDSTSLGGLDLRGQKVRHHKMPSLKLIVDNGDTFTSRRGTQIGTIVGQWGGLTDGDIFNGLYPIWSQVSNTSGLTYNTVYSLSFVALQGIPNPQSFTISVTLSVNIVGGTPGDNYQFNITDISYGTSLNTLTNFFLDGAGNYSGSVTATTTVVLDADPINPYDFSISTFVQNITGSSAPASIDFLGSVMTIENYNIISQSKPIGIRVSNVEIPTSLIGIVDTWSIYYAKRSAANIRIIGQDIIKKKRFHSFDLVSSQSFLRANYLKPQIKVYNSASDSGDTFRGCMDNVTTVQETGFATEQIEAITEYFYVGENTSVPVNNINLSSSIYITILDFGFAPDTGTYLHVTYNDTLLDMCIYKQDVYNSFQEQDLVSTGYSFKITASGLQTVQKVYGGDCFISAYGFVEDAVNFYLFLIPCESASNIGLRNEDILLGKYYYPKYTNSTTPQPTLSYYGYNQDYSAINDLNKVFPKRFDEDCTSSVYKFPQLIARSISDANETTRLGWRTFKANSYYEMPKDRGVIWNLEGSDRTLFIQHEYSLFIAVIKDAIETTTGTVFLGVSDLFDRPPVEKVPVTEGYIGCRSQFASMICQLGYCVVDRDRGRVFIVTGIETPPVEISNQGMFNFWEDNAQTGIIEVDNPFNTNGYCMTFDDEQKRLIITKIDVDLSIGGASNPFTISYFGNGGYWICFHDYYPNYYYSVRQGLFCGDNFGYKLYKMNDKTSKAKFFGGTIYPSYIDAPFNEKPEVTKLFGSISWITEVQKADGTRLEADTITHVLIYNNNQCSGVIVVKDVPTVWYDNNGRNVEGTWFLNKFRDLVKNKAVPFLDDDNQVIVSNINSNKPWYDKSQFLNKFIIVRYSYDNTSQNDMYLIAVGTNVNQSGR